MYPGYQLTGEQFSKCGLSDLKGRNFDSRPWHHSPRGEQYDLFPPRFRCIRASEHAWQISDGFVFARKHPTCARAVAAAPGRSKLLLPTSSFVRLVLLIQWSPVAIVKRHLANFSAWRLVSKGPRTMSADASCSRETKSLSIRASFLCWLSNLTQRIAAETEKDAVVGSPGCCPFLLRERPKPCWRRQFFCTGERKHFPEMRPYLRPAFVQPYPRRTILG